MSCPSDVQFTPKVAGRREAIDGTSFIGLRSGSASLTGCYGLLAKSIGSEDANLFYLVTQ